MNGMRCVISAVLLALAGCSDTPRPAGTLYYKVSGVPGTPVTIEYYGTAVRPGDRRYARDLIVKETVLPQEGYLRFWGDAEAGGRAMMAVKNRDPLMKDCVTLQIQIDERAISEGQACLKSYATHIDAIVPSL